MIEGVGGLGEVDESLRSSVNTVKIVEWFIHVAIVVSWMIIAAKVKTEMVHRS